MNTGVRDVGSTVFEVAAIAVRSELPLSSRFLPHTREAECTVRVVERLPRRPGEWIPSVDDLTWWEARSATGWWLRVDGIATAHVNALERTIDVRPEPFASMGLVAGLIADAVVPTFLALAGKVVFHATAVEVAGGAVAFLGRSMAGKSSMAAAFATMGCPVLADDCLRVERIDGTAVVLPTAFSPRLRVDAAEKLSDLLSAISPSSNGPARQPVPLARLCLLRRGHPELVVEPVRPAAAAAELVPHLYFGRCSPERSWELVGRVVESIEGVEVVRLSYPDDLDWMLHNRSRLVEALAR